MVFLFAAALAVASSPTPSPSPSPLPQIAHVVTSDRGSESVTHSARTTYVVTATDIARNGNRTIADAIENLPGVEIQRYGAFGAQANVGIRGSSNSQVLVLLDGLPMAGAQIENVDLEQYGVAGIERIEVVEGGGSTLYGSGSIGGVINIITNGHAPTSATVATGSFDEQTYQFATPYLSFQRTYAGNAYPLPGGTTRTNADAGLTAGTLTFAKQIGAFDLEFLAGESDASLGAPAASRCIRLPPVASKRCRAICGCVPKNVPNERRSPSPSAPLDRISRSRATHRRISTVQTLTKRRRQAARLRPTINCFPTAVR